jgi:hypothetical protein
MLVLIVSRAEYYPGFTKLQPDRDEMLLNNECDFVTNVVLVITSNIWLHTSTILFLCLINISKTQVHSQ